MAGVRIAPLVALLTGCFAVGYEDLPSPDGDGGPVSTCSSDDDVGAPYAGGNGQAETPYRICTTDQLIAAITRSEDLGAYFELSDHLDLTGINFDGIGSMDTPFTGVFDGQGFTISGLNIATDMRSGVGFFNAVDGARISNLVFESPEIQADTSSSVGTVIGYCERSQLVNTTINDMVVRGGSDVGGIAGEQYECKLIGGTVSGTVVGQLDNVGGLVGATGQGDIIGFDATLDVDSPLAYSVGGIVGLDGWSRTLVQDVNVEGTVVGFEDVGGFLGANGDGIYFYRSTFKGEVTGKSGVGGFAGAAYDIPFTIRSSSADVTINGNSEVGGMVGRFYYRSHFYDSYVTGTINGTGANQDRFGGVFGGVEYYGWVERSYVNMTINSEARTVGGVAGGVGYWSANVDAYDIKDCITITDISGSSATDTVSLFVGENTDEPIIATGSVHYAGASCVNNGTGGCGPGGAGVANLADLYNPANAPMNTWDFDGIWVANAGAMPTLDLSRGSEPSVAASCDTQTLAQIDPDALPWVVTYNCDLAIADADKNEEHTVLLGPGHTCSWIYPERAALEGAPKPADVGSCVVEYAVTDGLYTTPMQRFTLEAHTGAQLVAEGDADADNFSWSFQDFGTTTPHTFTITNKEPAEVTGLDIVIPSSQFGFEGGGAFPGTTGTCVQGGSLAPGASCTVIMTYTASLEGQVWQDIRVKYTGPRGPVDYAYTLTGYGRTGP